MRVLAVDHRALGDKPKLTKSTDEPSHARIEQWLRGRIAAGHLVPDDKLPPEEELAAALGVSRMTLRQALGSLEATGVLERRRGRAGGTFIREQQIDVDLTGLPGFTEQMSRSNIRAGARVISVRRMRADRAVAAALELTSGKEVFEIIRVRSANREPLALEETYLPCHLFAGPRPAPAHRLDLRHHAQRLRPRPSRRAGVARAGPGVRRARRPARRRARRGADARDADVVHGGRCRRRARVRPLPRRPHPHQPAHQCLDRGVGRAGRRHGSRADDARQSLDELFDQIPSLADQPRTIVELPGGLTNLNLKVTTPSGVFVARCSRSDTSLLGIDREAEHANTRSAELAGVGAPVVEFRPDLDVLVIGFIDGRSFENEDLRKPGALDRVAEAVRTLHAGPRFVGDFDMFTRQQRYLASIVEGGFAHPVRLRRLRRAVPARSRRRWP